MREKSVEEQVRLIMKVIAPIPADSVFLTSLHTFSACLALHFAASGANTSATAAIASLLLKHGADINAANTRFASVVVLNMS
jgi:hypothetical protein